MYTIFLNVALTRMQKQKNISRINNICRMNNVAHHIYLSQDRHSADPGQYIIVN